MICNAVHILAYGNNTEFLRAETDLKTIAKILSKSIAKATVL